MSRWIPTLHRFTSCHRARWNTRLGGCIHQLQSSSRIRKIKTTTEKKHRTEKRRWRKKQDFHTVACCLETSSEILWKASSSPVKEVVRMRKIMKINICWFLASTITVFIGTNTTPQLVVSVYGTTTADISIIKYCLPHS